MQADGNFQEISLAGIHDAEDSFRYSNLSTPTLTSDASSLRSSLSSFSSPILANGPFSVRPDAAAPPLQRKLSLPDNTSMASLSRIPVSQRRSHKQRENDYHTDTDDFWPTDAVMFNVPMSPALCAQAKKTPPSKSKSTHSLPAIKEQDMLDLDTREIQLKYAQKKTSASTSSLSSHASTTPSTAAATVSATSTLKTPKSLTRPTHLPPKSAQEERRHMHEYTQLVSRAKAQEKQRQEQAQEQARRRQQQRQDDVRVWEKLLHKNAKVSRTLWWRGVPEKLRFQAWTRALGVQQPLELVANSGTLSSACEDVFSECGMFGRNRPLNEALQLVVETAAHNVGIPLAQANPLMHAGAVFCLVMDEGYAAACLAALIAEGGLAHSVLVGNEAITQAHYSSFYKVFRAKFPQLYTHFTNVRLAPQQYLDPLVSTLMLSPLDIEAASRVVDLVVSEGEAFLLRTALGYIALKESALYQSRDAVTAELATVTVADDKLIDTIKSISR